MCAPRRWKWLARTRAAATDRPQPGPRRGSDFHRCHDPFRKDLLRCGQPVGDALLVTIAQESLERRTILIDAERERVAAELFAHFPRIGRQPGQRIARDGGVEQTLLAAPF